MIKVILFDLGGVIFTRGLSSFVNYIAKKHGKDQKVLYESLKNSDLVNKYYEGKILRDDFYTSLKKQLQIDDDINELEQKLFDAYQVIEETRQIVERVKRRYKVYFLSDNFKERVEAADKKYGFTQWFDGGIFSHEVGVRKPNSKIYLVALEKIGVKPEEILFIDDKEVNLPPAEKLGMKTLLYESPEQLEKELKKMKLL